MRSKIDDLYFGIKYWEFNSKKLVETNLFKCGRIKWNLAKYITIKNDEKKSKMYKIDDPLLFIFGDVWSRCEWEFLVGGLFNEENVEKQSVYDMYVKPNRDILLSMVDEITLRDAKRYLKENKI